MHPILIRLGDFTLHTFGLMAALGVLAGSAIVLRESRREGIDEDYIRRVTFGVVIAVIVGGRLLDVIVNWERFREAPLDAIKIWKGGLVFYGGAIGVFLVVFFSARAAKRSPLQLADVYMVGGALGLAIGRIGCLMAGDDYGKPTDLPWGIRFTDPNALVPWEYKKDGGTPLHPTQIYMMLNALFIFAVTSWLAKRKKFDGQVFAVGFMIYAITRSTIELFRGDADRGFVFGPITTSQFISMFFFVIGVVIYARGMSRPKVATSGA